MSQAGGMTHPGATATLVDAVDRRCSLESWHG